MNVEISTKRKHAFTLRISQIRRLWDLLTTQVGAVNASVACADEITRKFTSLEQFESYDNPPAKMAVELTMDARSDDLKTSVTVEFSHGVWATINVRIRATERIGADIKGKILDILDGTKPWYSALVLDVRLALFVILVPALLLYFPPIPYELYETAGKQEVKSHLTVLVLLRGFAGVSILFIISHMANKIWSRLFPRTYFAFGQGKNRYSTVEKFRWGTLIAFVVSVAASLFVILLL